MKRRIHLVARSLLAGVFLVSSLFKLSNVLEFSLQVGEFGILPDVFVVTAAWAISLAELVTSILLVFRWRVGLMATVVLLCMFIVVLLYGVGIGLGIECGCFGPGYHVSLTTQLAFDFGLLLLSAVIYWSRSK